jgi:hypothetical protein
MTKSTKATTGKINSFACEEKNEWDGMDGDQPRYLLGRVLLPKKDSLG